MQRIGDGMDELLDRLAKRCKEETPEDVQNAINRSRWRRWRSRALTIGIPSELANFLVDKRKDNGEVWRETDAMAKLVTAFGEPGCRLVVLAGPTRTGKSLAAAWWLAEQKGSAFWVSAPKLTKAAPWSDEVKRVESADCLVIDDVGLGSETARGQGLIESVLYERFAVDHQLTVCTTNLLKEKYRGVDGFRERYNDRLVSRIGEAGAYVICSSKENRTRR